MANEFIARKGLIVSGSTVVTNAVTASFFSGNGSALTNVTATSASFASTASFANNADLLDGLNSTVFATTGSNTLLGSQTVSGSLNVRASTNDQDPILQISEFRGGLLTKFYESQDAGVLTVGYYGLTGTRTEINGGSSNSNTSMVMYQGASAQLLLTSNGTSYINGGNVGIGTSSPGANLDVLTSVISSTAGIVVRSAAGGFIRLLPSASGGSYNNITSAGDTTLIYSNGTQGAGSLVIAPWAAATSGIRMDGNGNVGIGTPSPGATLHVQGTISSSGNVSFGGNLTVSGLLTAVSTSIQYVTSSQLNVTDNKITVQSNDLVRFGGLSVYDSGSSNATASIYWDSLNHNFIYENLGGSSYNSAIIIAGPQNTSTLGNEVGLTTNRIPVAVGTDHIDSRLASSSIRVDFPSRFTHIEAGLHVTGSITSSVGFSGNGAGITGLTNSNLSGTAGITNANLANSTISGVSLGSNLNTLTISNPLSGTSYNGSSAVTIALASGYGDTQNPFGSKTANHFLAAPNGSAGAPTFRAIVAADIPTLNQNTTGAAASAGIVTGTTGQILRHDDRIIEPSAITSGYLQFGFTSWANNNTAPYADFLHMRSYTDSSGGNDNLVLFRKDAIGIRVYQQSFGSATAYSTYKDVAFTDSNITGTATNITAYTINQNVGTGNSPSFVTVTSTQATGTAPFTVTSTTAVTNLNADLLDGNHAAAFYLASNPSGYTTNTGTVTSVGGTGTVSGLTLSGTVTTTGNLTLGGTLSVAASNFASQTANTFLAAPNGSSGTPTFRAIVAADVPTLNQNTTGTASNITAYTINQNVGTSNTPTFNYVIFKDSINANTYGFRGLSGVITCDGGAQYPTAWNFQYGGTSTSAMYISSSGNVGIGTSSPTRTLTVNGSTNITGSLDVTGAFTAQTKSFKINHQTIPNRSLVYGVLEGPEHAVYCRGKLVNTNTITLPDEWEWLVDIDSITVQLTSIGSHQPLYVQEVNGLTITVGSDMPVNCYYIVHATRKDVEPLQTVE
jgi:hypothetical protein